MKTDQPDPAPATTSEPPSARSTSANPQPANPQPAKPELPAEVGGVKGPDPTRYGDWERKGRCIDF